MCALYFPTAGARPGHAPQPGPHEHGHQADRGLRETRLPPAAEPVSSHYLRQPAAALL